MPGPPFCFDSTAFLCLVSLTPRGGLESTMATGTHDNTGEEERGDDGEDDSTPWNCPEVDPSPLFFFHLFLFPPFASVGCSPSL